MPTTIATSTISSPEDQTPLEQAAASPRSVSTDGESVTEHSLQDQIAFDEYQASKKAGVRPRIHLTKLRPGGTV